MKKVYKNSFLPIFRYFHPLVVASFRVSSDVSVITNKRMAFVKIAGPIEASFLLKTMRYQRNPKDQAVHNKNFSLFRESSGSLTTASLGLAS